MKTITEYRPLIFSRILAEEPMESPVGLWDAALIAGYVLLALWMMTDTGFAPWQWQFWLVFGPLFAACELALWQIFDRPPV